MRRRRWTALLALFGVLLHVSLVAHHNSASLAAKLNHASIAVALKVICHGGTLVASPDSPDLPEPSVDWSFCPLCAGLAPAVAILSQTEFDILRPDVPSARVAVRSELNRVRVAGLRPLPRGPPNAI
ncbi:MAG: DUF2946 family protein [Hyphomicrobiaceae bacterium]